MTPIERAARAMYDNVKPDWDWDDPDAQLLRTMYRENARAAIAAIREPSGDMSYKGCLNHPPADTAGIWRAMIDAMLEEG